MLNMIGAVIVLLAGALLGFYQAAQYANRPKQIRQLIQAMQRLETEINYGFTPLPDALERISRSISEPAASMFRISAEQLILNNGISTTDSWGHVITNHWKRTSMRQTEMDIMLQLGTTLGISDRHDQIKHIHLAANQLQGEEETAKEDQQRYEKMWKSLGVLGGALIVILMY
jgi:stage III sporulation protein AB